MRTLLLLLGLAIAVPAYADSLSELPAPSGAPCPAPDVLQRDRASVAARAELTPPKAAATKTLHGLTLTDDERLVTAFERALGKQPPATFAQASACTSVYCALTKTLGSDEAALHWIAITLHFGAAPLLDQSGNKKPSLWQAAELRAVAQTILDLPPGLLRIKNVASFRRIPDGDNPFNGANAFASRKDPDRPAQGAIWFRDTAWKMPVRQLREIVAHELGHQLDFSAATAADPYPLSHSAEWLATSAWTKTGKPGKDAYALNQGFDVMSTGSPLASEEFADAIAGYRYTPRLMAAYSPAKLAYMKKLLGDFAPPKDEAIDAALKAIGGPLTQLSECAKMIQRTTRSPGAPQAVLYTVTSTPGGGTRWANVHRGFFLTRSSCVDDVIARMEAAQKPSLLCTYPKEELYVRVADRLETAWGAFGEAAAKIAAATTDAEREACVQSGKIGAACFAKARVADAEAQRIANEFAVPGLAPTLTKQLIAASAIAPPDDVILAKHGWLADPKVYLGACANAAVEISTEPAKKNWKYWVKLPPKNDLRGFGEPLYNAACAAAIAAYGQARGATVDTDDPLFQHFLYLGRNAAGAPVKQFASTILDGWEALRAACALPAATKATGAQTTCVANWLKPKLAPLVPADEVDALATALAPKLRGP